MRWIICFCFCLGVMACKDEDRIPSGIMAQDKMEKVLWEIAQADQFSTQFLKKDSLKINVKQETMKLYDQVFLINHISRQDFQKSLNFYLDHPTITKTMFDSLSAKANRRRMEIYRTPSSKLNVK